MGSTAGGGRHLLKHGRQRPGAPLGGRGAQEEQAAGAVTALLAAVCLGLPSEMFLCSLLLQSAQLPQGSQARLQVITPPSTSAALTASPSGLPAADTAPAGAGSAAEGRSSC